MKDIRGLPVRAKRRSRPSLRARLRTYWIVSAVVASLIIWGGVAIVRWNGFCPRDVSIEGTARVVPADVEQAAAVDHHANIWLANIGAMERRIEAIPYVAVARVHRRLPASVTIDVVERTADGCVRFAGRPREDDVMVDATRRVLASGCESAPKLRYLVHGAPVPPGRTLPAGDLATLQSDRHALTLLGRDFTTFSLDRFGGLDATLPDGIAVRFGDDGDLGEKERLIGPVLAAVADRLDAVRAVDVRAPSAPVVDYR